MKKKPDILIDFNEFIPVELIIKEFNAISECGVNVKINKRENIAYAALEWTIPTAIAAYVLKPYFETFLKEAGKEHYNILSQKLKAFLKKGKTINTILKSSSKSSEKLNKTYSQSQTISILIETRSGRIIKLLFDNNLDLNDWEDALDELLEYVIESYEKPKDNKFEKSTLNFKEHKNFKYYATINNKTKKIEFFDDDGLMKNIANK